MEALEQYRRTGKREKKTVNTRNILFIVSGAFNGLEDIIKKRMNEEGIGFGAKIRSKDDRDEYLQHATAQDLIEYGFESEFIGRLPVTAVFHQLEVEDLYHILKNPHGPIIASKKKDFRSYGIDLTLEDDALWELAKMAHEQRTGARGLISAIERVLLKFERTLPSTDIRQLVATKEMAKDPKHELDELLGNPYDEARLRRHHDLVAQERDEMRAYIKARQPEFQDRYGILFTGNRLDLVVDQVLRKELDVNSAFAEVLSTYSQIKDFEKTFRDKHSIDITLDDGARDLLLTWMLREERDTEEILTTLDNLFGPALKLIREKANVTSLTIPAEGVENPETYLDRLIKDVYRHTNQDAGNETP